MGFFYFIFWDKFDSLESLLNALGSLPFLSVVFVRQGAALMPPLGGTLLPALPFMTEEGMVKLFPGRTLSSLPSFRAQGLGSTLRTQHNNQEVNICSSDSGKKKPCQVMSEYL